MDALTLKDLKVVIDEAIKEGHGHKMVHLSNDDEGNGYHKMYYTITPVDKVCADYLGLDPDNDILVG